MVYVCNPTAGRQAPGVCWSDSLAYWTSSRSEKKKKKLVERWGRRRKEKDTWGMIPATVLLWLPHTHAHTHV